MKPVITESALPPGALLERYRADGGHVDCFVSDVAKEVDLKRLISAFYTSAAFRLERWLLGALLGKRADDADVARLAADEVRAFSAWTVEDRSANQLLLCDFQGKTRSWLMVLPVTGGTRLHFGSAVVPTSSKVDRGIYNLLLGFHRWYSRQLLKSALARL